MSDTDQDGPELITFDAAAKLLPSKKMLHTFRQSAGGMLLGADSDRAELVALLQDADEIHVTGAQAQSMGHGLAVRDSLGWLFIETVRVQS